MEEKKKRPRITRQADSGTPKIEDRTEYKANKATPNARHSEDITISLYHDQHYVQRNLVGEDDGTPREGINHEVVSALIKVAFGHLLFYSCRIDSFRFLNHAETGVAARRVLLQDSYSTDTTLNVIIEVHLDGLNKFQVTVVTAMANNVFIPFENTYVVEMIGDDSSILKKCSQKKLHQLFSYEPDLQGI